VQQLESSRVKLNQLEQELDRVRQQVIIMSVAYVINFRDMAMRSSSNVTVRECTGGVLPVIIVIQVCGVLCFRCRQPIRLLLKTNKESFSPICPYVLCVHFFKWASPLLGYQEVSDAD
jgi:hypothetical protein